MIEPQLVAAIERCVSGYSLSHQAGREDELFLVDLKVKNGGQGRRIEVLVETEKGVTISQCAALSRMIRDEIEENSELQGIAGEAFDLTVSSPGVGGAVLHPRQYIRHAGRLLRVHYRDGSGDVREVTGRLVQVDVLAERRPHIVLQPEVRGRRKKRAQVPEAVDIALEDIEKAVVQVEF
ncbi:MAG: ribosome maturation factor RimP [Prosthecochloris sp.]|nr:ribosome maturation factor RimP [Prosthecochloris sp.]